MNGNDKNCRRRDLRETDRAGGLNGLAEKDQTLKRKCIMSPS